MDTDVTRKKAKYGDWCEDDEKKLRVKFLIEELRQFSVKICQHVFLLMQTCKEEAV